jgi:hypothetical protein
MLLPLDTINKILVSRFIDVKRVQYKKGTYPVQPLFSCNHRAIQLTMFIKNMKIFIDVPSTLLYLRIEFQDPIHRNERAIKKIKFLTDLISQIYQKFLFFVVAKL